MYTYIRLTLSICLLELFFYAKVDAAQTCNTNSTIAATPTNQFTDNNDGTVTDNKTNLMWKKCTEGLTWNPATGGCDGIGSSAYTWQAALNRVSVVNSDSFAGNKDWRIPNIKELTSLVESQCYTPAINQAVFPNSQNGYFWSSSTNGNAAWTVDFGNGFDSLLSYSNSYQVRMVRLPTVISNYATICSTGIKSVLFSESFNSATINTAKWDVDTTGGSVVQSGGRIAVSGTNSDRFPVLQTKSNPFPTSGNFSLYCKGKYTQVGVRGTSACAAVENMVANGTELTGYDSGSSMGLHTENGKVSWVTWLAGRYYLHYGPDGNTNEHEYETCIVNSKLTGYRDGIKIGESLLPSDWAFPNKIYMGNPLMGSSGTWSAFDMDAIEVRELNP